MMKVFALGFVAVLASTEDAAVAAESDGNSSAALRNNRRHEGVGQSRNSQSFPKGSSTSWRAFTSHRRSPRQEACLLATARCSSRSKTNRGHLDARQTGVHHSDRYRRRTSPGG